MSEEIRKEVLKMGAWIFGLGGVLFIVLMFVRKTVLPVLTGTVVGCLTAWIYFAVLGFAVEHPENKARFSFLYLLRFVLIGVMAYWVLTTNIVDPFGALIPLVFPRLIIMLRARRGEL